LSSTLNHTNQDNVLQVFPHQLHQHMFALCALWAKSCSQLSWLVWFSVHLIVAKHWALCNYK